MSISRELQDELPANLIHRLAVDKVLENLSPFWIDTMIPVILCMVVIFILVAMLAVALIIVREFSDNDASLYRSFDTVGFEAMWARNAKLVMERESNISQAESDTSLNSPIEVVSLVPINAGTTSEKLNLDNYSSNDPPFMPPKPEAASNFAGLRKIEAV